MASNELQRGWLYTSFKPRYFHRPHKLKHRHERWRVTAKLLGLSREALNRLEWMIFHETHGLNTALTARHFGVSKKTFLKWWHRFDAGFLKALEEQSRAPKKTRQKEYTAKQYERIIRLRRAHIRYGKMKLLTLYRDFYPKDEAISSWKIQCIIEASGIYYHPQKQARINRRHCRSVKRKKITDLETKPVSGFLLCLDTVVRHWNGQKRYVLTAIDRHAKVAFARMYTTHSSAASRDFLYRLHYLLDGRIENIQTDNGSEFHWHFDKACHDLHIEHYWSRVKTPKDNAVNERFNRTLEEEFIRLGNMTADTHVFNQKLTEWLVEYNFRRPHQSLDYMPPMNFSYKYHKVLPMCPSSTNPLQIFFFFAIMTRFGWCRIRQEDEMSNNTEGTNECGEAVGDPASPEQKKEEPRLRVPEKPEEAVLELTIEIVNFDAVSYRAGMFFSPSPCCTTLMGYTKVTELFQRANVTIRQCKLVVERSGTGARFVDPCDLNEEEQARLLNELRPLLDQTHHDLVEAFKLFPSKEEQVRDIAAAIARMVNAEAGPIPATRQKLISASIPNFICPVKDGRECHENDLGDRDWTTRDRTGRDRVCGINSYHRKLVHGVTVEVHRHYLIDGDDYGFANSEKRPEPIRIGDPIPLHRAFLECVGVYIGRGWGYIPFWEAMRNKVHFGRHKRFNFPLR